MIAQKKFSICVKREEARGEWERDERKDEI